MIRFITFIIGLFISLSLFPQNISYDSEEQLINDINSRRYSKPIAFMKQQLDSIETNSKDQFPDTIYISMVNLLSATYVRNNQLYEADTLINHSMNYMIRTGRTSPYAYALFFNYGTLLDLFQNYNDASIYLKLALDILVRQKDKGENYAVIMSALAVCHMNMNNLNSAKDEIEESISIIENSNSPFTLSNKMGIYQKAGAIYQSLEMTEKAKEYTQKAYYLSKDNDIYVSEFINAANNLSVLYLNDCEYSSALEILHEMEKKPLSEKEKAYVYNSIFLANYYLDNEYETIKYSKMCSDCLMNISSELYTSLPFMTIENLWKESVMQLIVNMGILEKFNNNSAAVEMSFDNIIFIKSLSFNYMEHLRNEAKNNKEISSALADIHKLKDMIFSGDSVAFDELNSKERYLSELLKTNSNLNNAVKTYNWRDVKQSLLPNEFAIEIISYVGYEDSESNKNEIKYAALILSPKMEHPKFVELCSFSQLHDLLFSALVEQEFGINKLYLKGNDNSLYHMLWEKIEPFLIDAETIYFSPIMNLQDINIAYITTPNNNYLKDKYDIRIVASTAEICNQHKQVFSDAVLWGGIDYSNNNKYPNQNVYRSIVIQELSDSTRGGFENLQASSVEVDSIYNILLDHNMKTILFKGLNANEKSFREIDGHSPSILHFSTHGFYLVGFNKYLEYFGKLLSSSHTDNSMLFSGLLLAEANISINESRKTQPLNDGVITAEEISFMDLSKTELVVLSACETGIGVNTEGYGGLIRAFKLAGAKQIIASLWKVPDESTSKLMTLFYNNLMRGMEIHSALSKAQQVISIQYPDPYYWASFVIIE